MPGKSFLMMELSIWSLGLLQGEPGETGPPGRVSGIALRVGYKDACGVGTVLNSFFQGLPGPTGAVGLPGPPGPSGLVVSELW